MAHKNRKVHAHRGERTCGWGGAQKHRGAGSRGGRGNAGQKKKHHQISARISGRVFGKTGFKRPQELIKNVITINLADIDKKIELWVKEGKAKKTTGGFSVDVTSLGYEKVLGSGKLTHKIEVTADSFSKSAITKIEGAGGKAVGVDGVDTA